MTEIKRKIFSPFAFLLVFPRRYSRKNGKSKCYDKGGGDFSLQSRILRDFARNDLRADLESGEREAGASRPPHAPLTNKIHGHSDGVPKRFACLVADRLSGRLRNPLLQRFQLFTKMCH